MFYQRIFLIIILSLWSSSFAAISNEMKTSRYFNSIQSNPKQLAAFLYAFPKGADLHIHESGASFAENMLLYAAHDNLCVSINTYDVYPDVNCPAHRLLNQAIKNPNFSKQLIDAWSMRNYNYSQTLGHDHFFAAFKKFNYISLKHSGDILSEIIERAGNQNEIYMELMVTPDYPNAALLGKKIGWNGNLKALHHVLLNDLQFNKIVKSISTALTQDETFMRKRLNCNTSSAAKGCQIKIRYLYTIMREDPPEMVFAQLLTGFVSAYNDKRIVGINMVMPEDGFFSMRDYKLHMKMVRFLHRFYPQVKIALHAGELNAVLVPKSQLKSHIQDAVYIAKANRIGHGVDIAYENKAQQLLKDMAKKHILVEINLSSNAAILNVTGKSHPILLYQRSRVPFTLSTDDEGISRKTLTQEYERAVTTYHFTYSELKTISRNSIAYSFLPGKSLWQDDHYHVVHPACANDHLGSHGISKPCQTFLAQNEKADMQWKLEEKFEAFS